MNKEDILEIPALLRDVQMQRIFPDGKTFLDCSPAYDDPAISEEYLQQKNQPGFDLKKFVSDHFILPVPISSGYSSDANKTLEQNIDTLWSFLERQPDKSGGSLIPLPYPYIVPGGRFGEIYYWDSYFTMLGLKVSGKNEMIENMVKNFSFLIDRFGYIPNGNRTYFIGRSQPPFFSHMVQLLAHVKSKDVLIQFLPQLAKEHGFWMQGADELSSTNLTVSHLVQMSGGEWLNRYWDENETPRPESLREDVELSHQSGRKPQTLYRHLRAGAESGWDYSSRWFEKPDSFAGIYTTDIVPVDLNCLLFHLEQTIAEAYQLDGKTDLSRNYHLMATGRKDAIQKYLWNQDRGFYFDFDLKRKMQKQSMTLAGIFPLFVKIADSKQAELAGLVISEKFLRPGGLVSTLETTGQQWDAPNGWAPLQWTTITGLKNYGQEELAKTISKRWIQLNADVFKRTGKLMEKYNVVDTQLEAGGGEYAGQDGFGWTNGVLLALIQIYGRPDK
ncbi:MAG TPA: alpha,alpha-trehalase TreF [Puia sp.]